jgi:putative nucleotidyltransferase with HDIG domain
MQKLDEYLDKVKQLPPAPRIVPQLLTLLSQPNTESGKVVDLISHDPSLTTAVLRTCNSAFFAGATQVSTLPDAVTRVGYQTVYNLVVSISSAKTLATNAVFGIDVDRLWDHSVTSAVAAQIIARDHGDDESIVFTGALLHDIGKLVFSSAEREKYADLVKKTETEQSSLEHSEKGAFGFDHAEIGARLMVRWKFPMPLVACVWFHHHPADAKGFERLASYIYLGNMIAHFIGHGAGRQPFVLQGRDEALKVLDLAPDRLPQYMTRTFEQWQVVQTLLNIKG